MLTNQKLHTKSYNSKSFISFISTLSRKKSFNSRERQKILNTCLENKNLGVEKVKFILQTLSSNFLGDKLELFDVLLLKLKTEIDLSILIFSLQLIEIKPLLLAESKIVEVGNVLDLKKCNQLSLEYDEISKSKPYLTRVNGALLSLLFFSKIQQKDTNFISNLTVEYLNTIFEEAEKLLDNGVELNQIFMLMFNESLNQSITSDSGSNYEQRVLSILLGLGVDIGTISKMHDLVDKSTEYDFYFKLENRVYGVSAKRTLRERYKQFIKTSYTTKIDIILEFTLGIDLTEEKAKTIRQHNTYIVISDEVYNSREYLKNMEGIIPASKFTLDLLKSLK